jgi:CRISPR-associated protein Cas2
VTAAARRELLTVVAYDVTDDRRRARLATVLEDYGVRVQYSVFECTLGSTRLEELRRIAAEIIEPREDRIAYYRLCARCEREPRPRDAESARPKAALIT